MGQTTNLNLCRISSINSMNGEKWSFKPANPPMFMGQKWPSQKLTWNLKMSLENTKNASTKQPNFGGSSSFWGNVYTRWFTFWSNTGYPGATLVLYGVAESWTWRLGRLCFLFKRIDVGGSSQLLLAYKNRQAKKGASLAKESFSNMFFVEYVHWRWEFSLDSDSLHFGQPFWYFVLPSC